MKNLPHRTPTLQLIWAITTVVLLLSFPRYAVAESLVFSGVVLTPLWRCRLNWHFFWPVVIVALPVVWSVGLFNLWYDRELVTIWLNWRVPGGVAALAVLNIKTLGCAIIWYHFVTQYGWSGVMTALASLKVPPILIFVVQMEWRYLEILQLEARNLMHSYQLRGGSKMPWRDWGKLTGGIFLRSYWRSEALSQALSCRLFELDKIRFSSEKNSLRSWLKLGVTLFFLVGLRIIL